MGCSHWSRFASSSLSRTMMRSTRFAEMHDEMFQSPCRFRAIAEALDQPCASGLIERPRIVASARWPRPRLRAPAADARATRSRHRWSGCAGAPDAATSCQSRRASASRTARASSHVVRLCGVSGAARPAAASALQNALRISAAALRVNVIARICSGARPLRASASSAGSAARSCRSLRAPGR